MNIKDFVKGWIIGNFKPSLYNTESLEVAIKFYKKGECEASHYHKLATEFTVITAGRVRMGNRIYVIGDIIEIKPYESTDFEALEDSATTVIKIPSVIGDKYFV